LDTLKSGTVIGQGGNARVYTIAHYPDLVLRVAHSIGVDNPDVCEPTPIQDTCFKGRNFGQAVAECGPGVTLLHFQKGVAVGVPSYLRTNDRQAENDSMYENSTALAASMPQEAYEALLQDMLFVTSIGMQIDPSKSNNMLIDADCKRFKLVDLNVSAPTSPYKNYPAELVCMLIDNSYGWQYKGVHIDRLQEKRKEILEKIISAAEKRHVPFFPKGRLTDSAFSYSLTLAGYAQGSDERASIEKRIATLNENAGSAGKDWLGSIPKNGSGYKHSV
jgi:hypothetical protein